MHLYAPRLDGAFAKTMFSHLFLSKESVKARGWVGDDDAEQDLVSSPMNMTR